ncbi:MAG: DUF3365 domain-containing protein [Planctomycetaceae bacterium]
MLSRSLPGPVSRWSCIALAVFGAAATIASLNAAEAPTEATTPEAPFPADAPRIAKAEARRQAEVLHSAMHTTLHLVHHRYYTEDEGLPIPAAVVEEVFRDVESEQPVRLRWLVVEGQAMNTDHRARTEFEHAAVEALKSGKTAYEQVEAGIYRRAGAIRLTNACLKCHVPDRKSTEDRIAGLIISLPVQEK